MSDRIKLILPNVHIFGIDLHNILKLAQTANDFETQTMLSMEIATSSSLAENVPCKGISLSKLGPAAACQ